MEQKLGLFSIALYNLLPQQGYGDTYCGSLKLEIVSIYSGFSEYLLLQLGLSLSLSSFFIVLITLIYFIRSVNNIV